MKNMSTFDISRRDDQNQVRSNNETLSMLQFAVVQMDVNAKRNCKIITKYGQRKAVDLYQMSASDTCRQQRVSFFTKAIFYSK